MGSNLRRAEVAGSQADRVQQHAHLSLGAANEGRFRHQRDLLNGVVHLRDHPAQGQVVVPRAVERQRQDGHVVDATSV